MKKLGPILAIISGVITIVFGILGILVSRGTVSTEFIGNYNESIAGTSIYTITLIIGILKILFGT